MNFGEFVRGRHAAGALVVQPRMGFGDPVEMRTGLIATRDAGATTVGTITLDSFTRVGDLRSVDRALRDGTGLNGYPIVNHDESVTRAMLDGVVAGDFPVQVRHGSARPQDIVRSMLAVGLHATEGGPVSYCLPYGRTPLDESMRNWRESCDILLARSVVEPHLETFGGCMMGQLCPPGQLVALSVLEAMFFHQCGVRSLSVSYAQQTDPAQDQQAVRALRRLCAEFLPHARWHVVVYAYMGVYPRTAGGARRLLARAAELAVTTGAERLIVKTVSESDRIATIAENIAALEYAAAAAERAGPLTARADDGQVYREAYAFVDAVLNCDADIGLALVQAFKRGVLDVPYCLHPDNSGRARGYVDTDGTLRWADIGALPLSGVVEPPPGGAVDSTKLLQALTYVRTRYDTEALREGQ